MQTVVLSPGEKGFYLDMLSKGLRIDGRKISELREFRVTRDVLPLSQSSVRVTYGNGYNQTTEAIMSISTEVVTSKLSELELSVKSLDTAFGEDSQKICEVVRNTLLSFIKNSGALAPEKLQIPNVDYSWKVYIDVLFLKAAGGIYEVPMVGIRIALASLRFPQLTISPGDSIAELHFDIDESKPPRELVSADELPLALTFSPLGNELISDPLPSEVSVLSSLLVAGFTKDGKLIGLTHFGSRGMDANIITDVNSRVQAMCQSYVDMVSSL